MTVTYPGALVASYTLFSTCSSVRRLSGKQKDPKVSLQLQTTLPIHVVYFWEYLLGSKKYYISQKINIQSHHIVDSQQQQCKNNISHFEVPLPLLVTVADHCHDQYYP